MADSLLRGFGREAGVRAFLVTSGVLAREAGRRHELSPLGTAALGYGLTAAALLGATLKVQQRVALKVEGEGRVGKLVTEADSYGRVRGYGVEDAGDEVAPSPEAVAAAIGRRGELTVVKDLRLRNLYQSVITLESGRLDRELMRYLNTSEQTPSLVAIDLQVDAAGEIVAMGGLLLQSLPAAETDALDQLGRHLDELPPLGSLLAQGATAGEILARVFGDVAYETIEPRPVEFACTCSWARSRQALKLLGLAEVESLMADGEAVVDCHFCHERYVFDHEELEAIRAELV